MFKRFIMPTFLFNVEKWKWNEEYRVYVSNLGHFKDEYKNPLGIKINNKGYVLIKTYCGLRLAHRLVLMTWNPTVDMENLTVDHLDHNKRNNAFDNLEWVTREENWRRAKEDLVKGNIKTEKEAVATIFKIGCKGHIFNDFNEAADFLIAENKIKGKGIHKTVARRIKNAIELNKKYFNREWYYVSQEV